MCENGTEATAGAGDMKKRDLEPEPP